MIKKNFEVTYRMQSGRNVTVDKRWFDTLAELTEWFERQNELEYTVIVNIIDLTKKEP